VSRAPPGAEAVASAQANLCHAYCPLVAAAVAAPAALLEATVTVPAALLAAAIALPVLLPILASRTTVRGAAAPSREAATTARARPRTAVSSSLDGGEGWGGCKRRLKWRRGAGRRATVGRNGYLKPSNGPFP